MLVRAPGSGSEKSPCPRDTRKSYSHGVSKHGSRTASEHGGIGEHGGPTLMFSVAPGYGFNAARHS